MMNHKHITKAKLRARIQDKDKYEMEMNWKEWKKSSLWSGCESGSGHLGCGSHQEEWRAATWESHTTHDKT